MASSHDGTLPRDLLQGLVAGTSSLVCADLYTYTIVHALLYNTILKRKTLKKIRNYLQYDTDATKKNTSTTIQLLTD